MIPERRRFTYALLLSLLIHTLLLSLNFGGWELWLPNFSFLWQERQAENPDLRVVLDTGQITAEPAVTPDAEPTQQAPVEQPAASETGSAPSASPAPTPQRPAAVIAPKAGPPAEAVPNPDAASEAAPPQTPSSADRLHDEPPQSIPSQDVIAATPTEEPARAVPAPATPAVPTPVITAAPGVSSPEIPMPPPADVGDAARVQVQAEEPNPPKQEEQRQAQQLEAARAEAARAEAARAEAARVEAARVEAARAEAARVEAARAQAVRAEAERAEAARAEAARAEAERVEAARAEAARVEAARAEAERAAAARAEVARAEVARAEAARVEAERAAAAQAEAERAAAARAEAARVEAERAEIERREAARRAIGQQLDEEAAQRQAAAASRSLPSSYSLRRYKLFGRTDPNPELIRWVEAWARKIQMNMTIDMVRDAAKQPHIDPVVTVAIRSDGSVESVTFVLSSGVAAIDDAIRRVVDSQAPYPAFPPGLAREWDVIEIRRTWYFDVAIRLY